MTNINVQYVGIGQNRKSHYGKIFDENNFLVENIDALSWKVPITYTTARDPKKSKFLLLSSRTARLPIKNEAWFKLNSNADGYFIVNYDAKNWNSLSQQLQKDPSVFSILDRSSLIKDVFTLAEEGIVTYDTAFDMTLYLRKVRRVHMIKRLVLLHSAVQPH